MKNALKVAWIRGGLPTALAILFFFFVVVPARAPSGGKLWSGGRTIASLQEEEFDRRLLKLQLCYGVHLVADQCMLERRRVCKALVVHEMESVLETNGNHLRAPMEIHCEDTALGKTLTEGEEIVNLRPNAEVSEIHAALKSNLKRSSANLTNAQYTEVKDACEFLTDCKWAMRPQSLSLRKFGTCLSTGNSMHRTILLNEIGSMLFGGKQDRRNTLFPRLEEAAAR